MGTPLLKLVEKVKHNGDEDENNNILRFTQHVLNEYSQTN